MAKYIIDFPDELHKNLKVQAAMEGTTLKDLILKAVEEYLERKRGKRD